MDEIDEGDDWGEGSLKTFEADGGTYLVLTDAEADEAARKEVERSMWAFSAEWIASHCKVEGVTAELISKIQELLHEDAQAIIVTLIGDMEHFVSDSILADGRGHFLASYNSEEHEYNVSGEATLYVYQVG